MFTYTAQRRACFSFVGAFAGLFLLEGAVTALLIAVLVRNGPLRVTLLAALILLIGWTIAGFLLAPLWTSHRLTPTELILRYGWDTLRVPRAAIVAARPVRERLPRAFLVRAEYEAKHRRIVAAFSEEGQVLLQIDRPRRLAASRNARPVERVLLNVDRRDAFLAALAVPAEVGTASVPSRLPEVGLPPPDADTAPPARRSIAQPTRRDGPPAILADGLTRRYGGVEAVDGLHLAIAPGEIYGFLGPNGAGKTTTIKMLVGLLAPSAGRVAIAGHDIQADGLAARSAFGYVADRAILYERLSGREFLQFLAQLRGLPLASSDARIGHLLGLLELRDRADAPCGTYSFGMKRKLALAGALLHRPSALILDEPLNGLDPLSARRLKDLFGELATEGTAVLLSTHDLATAEAVCHRVGILQRGRLIAEGSARELRRLADAPDLEAVFLNLTADEVGEVEEAE